MELISFQSILYLVLFVIPGYLSLFIISIFTDYLKEKNSLDKAVEYLLFSFFSYLITIILISFSLFFVSLFIDIIFLNEIKYFFDNPLTLAILTIIISPFSGFFLGKYYFGKGYPHKHFNTLKCNSPSIYSKYINYDFKEGAWINCFLKDGTAIRGKWTGRDFDEEKRSYKIVLQEAERFFLDEQIKTKLHGDKIVINVDDCYFIEFKGK